MKVKDLNKNEYEIVTKDEFEVIKNVQGDIFLKYPNGILEIYYSRNIEFRYHSTQSQIRFFVVENVPVPQDVKCIENFDLTITSDGSGNDVIVAGYGRNDFVCKYNDKISVFYVYSPSCSSDKLSKNMHFKVTGRWK